jgi:prepilin-type N-terminal cleavage/methylation domain-containing protein
MSAHEKGMSLIEVIVAVAITGIIMVVIGTFQTNVFVFNRTVTGSLVTSQDARAILRTMVAELRASSPGSNGAYPIITAATNTLAFYSDVNGDGKKEQVRYFASSTTSGNGTSTATTGSRLYRGVIAPVGIPVTYATSTEQLTLLASNLRNDAANPIFTYYDGTYNGTASTTALTQPVAVALVRLVKISLILDVDQKSLPVSRTYTSEAALRNLKDNL